MRIITAFAPLAANLTAAPPSPSEILQRAFDNEVAQQSLRAQYFYREHAERRRAGPDGKPGKLTFTHDYEWIYLEGEPFRKFVPINGHPLKGKKAQQQEARMKHTPPTPPPDPTPNNP